MNFFSAITHRVGDLVSHPVKLMKDTIKNPKKGLHEWGDLYTHNEHQDQDLFQKGFGIKGWVGKHPQEFAGAVVATIFGGWAAMGAYGGSAAAGATGAAGSTAGGTGIAAGTAIGQTVPATPAMVAGTAGATGSGSFATGAGATYAATATPSYSILAGSGYGMGGSYATSLGGEAEITNTGLSSSSDWFSNAKKVYDNYNRLKSLQQNSQARNETRLAQPGQAPDLLSQMMQGSQQLANPNGQMQELPQDTTGTANFQLNTTGFKNQFGV